MRIYSIFSSLLVFLFLQMGKVDAQIDSTIEGNVHYLKLGNGSNAVLMPLPSAPNTELAFHIITGGLYENDSVNGIAHVVQYIIASKMNEYLNSNKGSLTLRNTFFQSYTNSERTVFKLTLPSDSAAAGLNIFIRYVLNATFNEADLKRAVDSITIETEREKQNPKWIFNDKMLKSLYKREYEQLNVYGNLYKIQKIDLPTAEKFFKKYYVTNNAILIGTGSFNYSVLERQYEDQFKPIIRAEFDPEFITKITDFRSLVYNTQFIIEDSTATPEFQICWQFPGTSSNKQTSYSAALLCTLLNDKNNFIQVKAAKMGCKKFVAQYESGNYSGILRVTLQPDKQKLYVTYKFVIDALTSLEKTLVNESMIDAAKLQFKRSYENIKQTREFPENVVNHWAYKDDAYYLNVADSVMTVTKKAFATFVIEYMNLDPHVSGLLISKADRQQLKIDTVFTDLNDSVSNYVFRYLQNVTDLEGAQNLTMQQNLLQWLLLNKEVDIQVNGYSDKREFNKARDKAVMAFLDSVPTFRKVTSALIEKGYMRPEMMRAIKIVKFLYEHGVEADRLSGTAMDFSSSTDAEAIENAKCTITLNKLRKNIPLREYHYGKPKD